MSHPISDKISTTLFRVITATIFALLPAFSAAPAFAAQPGAMEAQVTADPEYIEAIQNAANMTGDPQARDLAAEYGLNLVNVMWEDTGRYKDSSVGPNISDVTIQVQYQDSRSEGYLLSLMPVIRFPNFSDKTADISLDKFYLLVGNEKGEALHKVSLREYLGNFRQYLHDPDSWAGRRDSLLAERDSYALVSAQAAFLPVPRQGMAEFNPVIFNYQSYQGDPAVLTIVASREGTSATIIDNVRDGFEAGYSWGQRLFFNQNGERASFTGQRISDFMAEQTPEARPDTSDDSSEPASAEAAGEGGLNMVLIIQVPLKQKNPMDYGFMVMEESAEAMPAPNAVMKSDVEEAVIGHGKVEGPYTEIDNLDIERDERFPVRVTVQFYKATSNGVVSEADVKEIAEQIERVYDDAAYVGSLVVGGDTGRPTEYDGPKEQPEGWWDAFWQRFTQNTDLTREQAKTIWERLKMFVGWR
ncbi:MAG: hypothetical protein JW908_07305 [Anaerolineales bacterium]|nr:hypothetical protein [Anaerolineales bacterium]